MEKGKEESEELAEAFTGVGTMVNSADFNGIESDNGIIKISEFIEKENFGSRTINYRLRDWLISRQRYWGTPIPIIHCEKCGEVPVPESQLPVELPYKLNLSMMVVRH